MKQVIILQKDPCPQMADPLSREELHGRKRDDEWDARMAVTQTLVWFALLYLAGAFNGGEP